MTEEIDMNNEECIKKFLELGSPFIADGMQKLGLARRIADPALRPLIPGKRVAGTVVTMLLDFYPTEQPPIAYAFDKVFEHAKELASPVLVSESRLGLHSPFGGGACRSFVHASLSGVIIDGTIRDTADVKNQGMQMFHRLISAESFVISKFPEGYIGAEAEVDVCVGGAGAATGDLVIADEDGIVFCRAEDANSVIEAAREILAEEEAIFNRWDSGQTYLEGLGIERRE